MNDSVIHHYPPDLLSLLVEAIPRLVKSKHELLDFFKGSGVPESDLAKLREQVRRDRNGITKFEIARQVLTRINDSGDAALAPRREVLKRVTQWENYASCYENERMRAKGYVAEIARLVNVKDSFTRMNQERERVEQTAKEKRIAEINAKQKIRDERDSIRTDLASLFLETDASARGVALEVILNRLFKSHGILVRDAFRRIGDHGEGIVEQIDGAIDLDGHIYLVEMKWRSGPLDVNDVSRHMVRIFTRDAARGIMISQSSYTGPAIAVCRDALAKGVFVLTRLSDIFYLMERDGCLKEFLRERIRAGVIDKNPLV